MLVCKAGKLVETIWPLVQADIPVFIHGLSGIGKSQMIREQLMPLVAQKYGDSVLHDFRLSTKDTVDGTGMPVVVSDEGGKATQWTRPAFIPYDDGKMHIVFLDEVGHASVQMQHAVGYQLTLDRALGEFKLPKNNRIILALNTREAKGGDNKLAKPFENRGAHVLVELDVSGWVTYAIERKIDPRLVAFIKIRSELLHKMDTDNPAWPSPRTVEMLSRVMHEPIKVVENSATALCGKAFAAQLVTFIKHVAAKLPKPEEIKANPDSAKVPEELDLQFIVGAAVSELIDVKTVSIYSRYLKRLEADIRSTAASNAMARDKKLEDNEELKKLVIS